MYVQSNHDTPPPAHQNSGGRDYTSASAARNWSDALPSLYWLNCFVGAVLLFAAAFKAQQLLDGTLQGDSLFGSRPFHLLIVEVDLVLGLWLVSGFRHQSASSVAVGYFLILAATAGFMLIQGDQTCGCFGAVQIKPWITFLFDLCVICALVVFPRSRSPIDILPVRLHLPAMALVVFSFVGPYLILATPPDRRITTTLNVESGEFGETVILDVENWTGKRFPILQHLNGAERLERGKWTAVLFNRDCDVCERFLRQIADEKDRKPPLALIEVVAVGRVATGPPAGVKGALHTHLTGWRRWMVQTPTIVELEDGKVLKIRVGAGELSSNLPTTKE